MIGPDEACTEKLQFGSETEEYVRVSLKYLYLSFAIENLTQSRTPRVHDRFQIFFPTPLLTLFFELALSRALITKNSEILGNRRSET